MMSQLFFTADEHIGHGKVNHLERAGRRTGVLHWCKRPFDTLEQMKQVLIERHNAIVPPGKGTLTVHVGDWFWTNVSLEEALEYIHALNGRHAFQYGNHDEFMEKYGRFLVEQGHLDFIYGENKAGGTKIYRHQKRLLTVDHFAHRVWQGSHKGHGHVYGHSHNGLPGLGKSFDIGVDGHDFYPWSMEDIWAKMDTLAPHHTIDNTGRPDETDNVDETRLHP